MTDMTTAALERELKKGAAELMVLSVTPFLTRLLETMLFRVTTHDWVGPSPNTMIRSGYNKTSFRPGVVVEFCGYVQPITGWLAFPEITLPGGQRISWLDDGNLKCGKTP